MARQWGDDATTVANGAPREQAMAEWLSSLGLAEATLEAAEIAPTARAEEIDLKRFCDLARRVAAAR